jgi:ankyrin repeat protein
MSDDIFTAAEKNNVKRLEQFLADGIDVNLRDYDRHNTPIHWAASGGNLDAIELLLEYGADVNAQNKNGRTPLHCLISERFDKIALWLIKCCGADPHIPDKRGVSAYDLAQKFFQPEIDGVVLSSILFHSLSTFSLSEMLLRIKLK